MQKSQKPNSCRLTGSDVGVQQFHCESSTPGTDVGVHLSRYQSSTPSLCFVCGKSSCQTKKSSDYERSPTSIQNLLSSSIVDFLKMPLEFLEAKRIMFHRRCAAPTRFQKLMRDGVFRADVVQLQNEYLETSVLQLKPSVLQEVEKMEIPISFGASPSPGTYLGQILNQSLSLEDCVLRLHAINWKNTPLIFRSAPLCELELMRNLKASYLEQCHKMMHVILQTYRKLGYFKYGGTLKISNTSIEKRAFNMQHIIRPKVCEPKKRTQCLHRRILQGAAKIATPKSGLHLSVRTPCTLCGLMPFTKLSVKAEAAFYRAYHISSNQS